MAHDDDGRPARGDGAEQTIVAALGRVRGYRIAGDQLTLVDEFGQPALTAVAVAPHADNAERDRARRDHRARVPFR